MKSVASKDGGVGEDVEIGGAVAVDVGEDLGVAAGDLVAQLARLAGEGAGADEGEGVVCGGSGDGVDRRQVDPVLARRRSRGAMSGSSFLPSERCQVWLSLAPA